MKRLIALSVLICLSFFICAPIFSLDMTGYEPYSNDEFPKWTLDLRRAECIFFGGIPIAYPLTALAFSIADKETSFLQNLAIACSVSAAIALIDYIIGVVNAD